MKDLKLKEVSLVAQDHPPGEGREDCRTRLPDSTAQDASLLSGLIYTGEQLAFAN